MIWALGLLACLLSLGAVAYVGYTLWSMVSEDTHYDLFWDDDEF